MKEKNILFIASQFPPLWGGVATYSCEIAKGFSDQGHKVTVVTGQNKGDTDFKFEVKRVRLGKTGITSIPQLIVQLLGLLRKRKFDHVFCSLWLPDGVAFYLAQKFLNQNTPYSISVHAMEVVESGENIKKRIRQKLSPLKKACFQAAKKIFCVSLYSKKLIESLVPLESENVVVINNGANQKNFFPGDSKKEGNYPRLFTACRLISNKGVDQVIKSLPDLVKSFPNIEYRIAGEGPDMDRLVKLSEMMHVQNQVKFLKKISLDQLRQEFQEANLFVMLSRKEKHFIEGFGLVFLEAALCQTASLGGNSGGIPDAIEDNITGWLVDPYSEQAITEKLKLILSDKEKLKQVSLKAYEETLNSKTWPHRIEQFSKELGF